MIIADKYYENIRAAEGINFLFYSKYEIILNNLLKLLGGGGGGGLGSSIFPDMCI